MKAALRLVDVAISNAPETPSPLSTMMPTLYHVARASLRPTLSPSACRTSYDTAATLIPTRTGSAATEPPTTQRSATVHPRVQTAARHEATNLLAVMRLNVDFLQLVLHGDAAALAKTALADLQQGIDRLERQLAASAYGR